MSSGVRVQEVVSQTASLAGNKSTHKQANTMLPVANLEQLTLNLWRRVCSIMHCCLRGRDKQGAPASGPFCCEIELLHGTY